MTEETLLGFVEALSLHVHFNNILRGALSGGKKKHFLVLWKHSFSMCTSTIA